MERKSSTVAAAAPGGGSALPPAVGVCERLFNALQIHPTFTNIRRLTNRQSGGAASATAQDQASFPVPTPPPMATNPQPGQARPPSPATPAPPSHDNPPVLVSVRSTLGSETKVQGSVPPAPVKDKPVPAAGKVPTRNMVTSVVKAALEAKTPPQAAAAEEPNNNTRQPPAAGKPKKNLNDKVEAYINRTRNKMRAPSHIGRTTTTTTTAK